MLSASQYTALRAITNCPGPTGSTGSTGSGGPSGPSGPTGSTGSTGPGSEMNPAFSVRTLTGLPWFEWSVTGISNWSTNNVSLIIPTVSPAFVDLSSSSVALSGLMFNGSVWVCGVNVTNASLNSKFPQFLYSTNGKYWVASESTPFPLDAVASRGVHSIAWNGYMFVAVGKSGGGSKVSIAYSMDNGVTWTAVANSGSNIIDHGRGIAWNGIAWVLTGTVASPGTSVIAYSFDGINWTTISGSSSSYFSDGTAVATDGLRWIISGTGQLPIYTDDPTGSSGWTFLTSVQFPLNLAGLSVTRIGWNGAEWLLVASSTFNTLAISRNGLTWTTPLAPANFVAGRGLSWTSSNWLITGSGDTNQNRLLYTNDIGNWVAITTPYQSTGIASRNITPLLNRHLQLITRPMGSTVPQTSSRTNPVSINGPCGTITLFSAVLNANASNTFTLNNSTIASTDMVIIQMISPTASIDTYTVRAISGAGSASVTIRNNTATNSASEAPVLRFVVIKYLT